MLKSTSLPSGTTVAGYQIERVIGSGGMGVVYEATQISLGRKIALKVLASHMSEDEEFQERFRREGILQASLTDPHIVTVFEAGSSEYGLFIAMQLVRGRDLKKLLLTGEIPPEGLLKIVEQIASALDAAHIAGLIHRDVKPQNILVEEATGRAYLADFGLTKAPGQRSLTRSGGFVGSLDYISPEQIRGEAVTPASDIYSLTAILFEALSGEVPYPRDTEAAVLYAHLSDTPPPLSYFRPELAPLDPVLERGLAKDQGDRYQTAGAMIKDAKRLYVQIMTDRALAAERALRASEDHPSRRSSETVIDHLSVAAPPPVPKTERKRRFPRIVIRLKDQAERELRTSPPSVPLRPAEAVIESAPASVAKPAEPLRPKPAGKKNEAAPPAAARKAGSRPERKGIPVYLGALIVLAVVGVTTGGFLIGYSESGTAATPVQPKHQPTPKADPSRSVAAAAISRALVASASATKRQLGAMSRAKTSGVEAGSAASLAHTYAAAALMLDNPSILSQTRPVGAALQAASSAFSALARAARANDSNGYVHAANRARTSLGVLTHIDESLLTSGFRTSRN